MHPLMNQEIARSVQRDYREVAAFHQQQSSELKIHPEIDSAVVCESWRTSVSSGLARLRLIQLQWPIRFSEG